MKLVDIVGARPQFIKVGPILRAIGRHNRTHPNRRIREILVHTGQHYDYAMSKVFFEQLAIKEPDYHLGVGSGPHAYQTGEMLKRIEAVLLKERPDVVTVYGDTNSTLAGALAAAKLGMMVAHVEAGLRSFNKRMLEETNRILTDHVSGLLFCPTETSVKNLQREGIAHGVHLVGDVMYDSAVHSVKVAEQKSEILERLKLKPQGYALATVHRAENTDDPKRLSSIFQALDKIARDALPVIVPLHPRTRKKLRSLKLQLGACQILEPFSYLDMLLLEKQARVVLTDSGGVQKEAFYFGVPCVTLRDETEWVETVQAKGNILAGAGREKILRAFMRMSQSRSSPSSQEHLGGGRAAEVIVRLLARIR
jgi:UDP-N-acetylglucosamine 2-epimerase